MRPMRQPDRVPQMDSNSMDETADAEGPGRIEQALGAGHVGADKRCGVGDGAVHVGLGGEIDHGLDAVFLEKVQDQFAVGDVAPGEEVALAAVGGFDIGQTLAIAGVGERIEVDDGEFVMAICFLLVRFLRIFPRRFCIQFKMSSAFLTTS